MSPIRSIAWLRCIGRVTLILSVLVTAKPCSAEGQPGDVAPAPSVELGTYYRLLGGVGLGRGLRFNNPYRLRTELGDGPESLSLTATFVDVWAAVAFGAADGLQHGGAVHGSFATDGVAQEVLTPSYLLLLQPLPRWVFTARAGIPIVIEPDANAGGEVSAGAMLLLTAGLGLTAEVSASVFLGAATLETSRTVIPVVSAQLGAAVDYEVLP